MKVIKIILESNQMEVYIPPERLVLVETLPFDPVAFDVVVEMTGGGRLVHRATYICFDVELRALI